MRKMQRTDVSRFFQRHDLELAGPFKVQLPSEHHGAVSVTDTGE